MTPCTNKRKLIALSIFGQLKPSQRAILRVHLEQCEGCRTYFDEMSGVATALAGAKAGEDIRASAQFHKRLVGNLKAEQKMSMLTAWVQGLRQTNWNWRIGLGLAAAAAVALIGMITFIRPADIPVQRLETRQSAPEPQRTDSLDPTISNYEMVANLSPERFDKLLTEQGSRNLSPLPVYRAVGSPLEIGAD